MKTFKLNATVTISLYTEVEAETLQEAIEISQERSIEMVNNWGSDEQAQEVWVSSEFDGSPTDIHES